MVFYDENGMKMPFKLVESAAARRNIHLRSGCMCNTLTYVANPGVDELFDVDWQYSDDTKTWALRPSRPCGKEEYGVVRISLGMPSEFRNIYAFNEFVRSLTVLDRYKKLLTEHFASLINANDKIH